MPTRALARCASGTKSYTRLSPSVLHQLARGLDLTDETGRTETPGPDTGQVLSDMRYVECPATSVPSKCAVKVCLVRRAHIERSALRARLSADGRSPVAKEREKVQMLRRAERKGVWPCFRVYLVYHLADWKSGLGGVRPGGN